MYRKGLLLLLLYFTDTACSYIKRSVVLLVECVKGVYGGVCEVVGVNKEGFRKM